MEVLSVALAVPRNRKQHRTHSPNAFAGVQTTGKILIERPEAAKVSCRSLSPGEDEKRLAGAQRPVKVFLHGQGALCRSPNNEGFSNHPLGRALPSINGPAWICLVLARRPTIAVSRLTGRFALGRPISGQTEIDLPWRSAINRGPGTLTDIPQCCL